MALALGRFRGSGAVTDLLTLSERLLTASSYNLLRLSKTKTPCLAFESEAILGFLHVYESPVELLARWSRDHEDAIRRFSFAFRRAEEKAWNTYAVFLAVTDTDTNTTHALLAIEEDLSATRKIARAGLHTSEDVRAALLPLLPIQNAPQLEAIGNVVFVTLPTPARQVAGSCRTRRRSRTARLSQRRASP